MYVISFFSFFFVIKITFAILFKKWIEEYLSNIETTTNQSLPLTTNQSEFNDTTWLEDLIHLDETSDCIMFNEFLADIPSTLNVSIDDEYSTSDSNQQSYSSIEVIQSI